MADALHPVVHTGRSATSNPRMSDGQDTAATRPPGRTSPKGLACAHPDGCALANGPPATAFSRHQDAVYCRTHYDRARQHRGNPGPPGVLVRSRLSVMAQRRIVDLFRTCESSDEEIAEIIGCGRNIAYSVVKATLSPTDRRELIKRRAWLRRKYHYAPDLFAAPLSDDEPWLFGLLMADGSTANRRVTSTCRHATAMRLRLHGE
jgi:hypothetical protein